MLTEASTLIKTKFVDIPIKTCLFMREGFMIQAHAVEIFQEFGHHADREKTFCDPEISS